MREGFYRNEVFDAITANDLKALGELFDRVGLTGKDARTQFTTATHTLVYTALGCAASVARSGKLHDATVTMLIDRTYSCVSAFNVAKHCLLSLGCSEADIDCSIIPEKVRRACIHDEYSAEVATAFAEMSEEQFKALLKLLSSGEVKSFDWNFSQSILAYMHMHDVVDMSVLLSIMTSALIKIDDGPDLGGDAVGMLMLLGALFG